MKRYLPKRGDLVRHGDTTGRVVRVLGDTGSGGGWLCEIAPGLSRADALRGVPAVALVRVKIEDVRPVQ